LQQGFTTATMVEDVPVSIPDNGGAWTPANYDHQYSGRVTMRDALKRSANAATVRVSRDVGMHNVISVARAMGIESDLPQVPSLALGAGAVTPIELTAAYAAFGNGGMRVTPHIVLRIDDIFGRTIWTAPPPMRTQALAEADAFLVTSMLRSVVDEGTGNGVRAVGVRGPVAGKTGTTNDGADVWFVGFTPSIVASVWFGTDKPQPLGGSASGGRIAAPVWANFIRNGWHTPEKDSEWVPPAGIVERWVDIATGMRADPWCGASRREWFKMGSEPIASCTESMIYAYEPLISGWGAGVLDDTTKLDTIIDTLIARGNAVANKMTDAVRALFRRE
jgi:penicillin-binding protein 1A